MKRPDIVYLTHRVPYPPDKGDRIRNYHLLKFLARYANVHLACLSDEPIAANAVSELNRYSVRLTIVNQSRWMRSVRMALSLGRMCSLSEGAFDSPCMRRVLREWGQQTAFHRLIISASSLIEYSRVLPGVPLIVDMVDVDSQKWLDLSAQSMGWKRHVYRVEARRVRRLESYWHDHVEAVTLVSQAECRLYERLHGLGVGRVATNGVDLDYFQPSQKKDDGQTCVFVGAMDYAPNIDAVCWFAAEVWPLIRARRPDAKWLIVGRRPTHEVRQLSHCPGVTVTGEVKDVRPFMSQAAVVLAPLRVARGLQNKVLEALACGKATVVSPQAITAFTVRSGTEVIAAATTEQWTEAVVGLLADPVARQRLGKAGRIFAETNHRWDTCLEPFARLVTPSLVMNNIDREAA